MQQLQDRRTQIILAIVGVVVLALLIWLILWLSLNGLWPVARDIALVVLAVITMVPLLALAYAVLQLARTAAALRAELVPMLSELKETTQTISQTAKVASEFTVKPNVHTASFMVGFQRATSIILGRGRAQNQRNAERKRRTREEAEALRLANSDGEGSASGPVAPNGPIPPGNPVATREQTDGYR